MLSAFEDELDGMDSTRRQGYRAQLKEIKSLLRELLGPLPGELEAVMLRQQYGQTRWDRARVKLKAILYSEEWDYSDTAQHGQKGVAPPPKNLRRHPAGTAVPLPGKQSRQRC